MLRICMFAFYCRIYIPSKFCVAWSNDKLAAEIKQNIVVDVM